MKGRVLLAPLHDSQAGTGGHKDVQAAYDLGYSNGSRRHR